MQHRSVMPRLLASIIVLALLSLASAACSGPVEEDAESAEGAASASSQPTDRHGDSYASEEVWLFGGLGSDKLLGCINCNRYDSDSVLNKSGTYGSTYGDTIWSSYGQYGGDYGTYSPWNEYSSNGPKLYTKDKSAYFGVFTANEYASGRTRLRVALEILEKGRDQ